MKKGIWDGIVITGAALGLVLIAVLIAAFIQHPPTQSGDWATWLGAIGTMLAFGGTIWLATTQERQRRRKEHNVAQLVAARVTGELAALIIRVQSLQRVLTLSHGIWDAWDELPKVMFPDTSDVLCDVQFLALLIPLEGKAAHCIARAVGILQRISADIAEYKSTAEWGEVSKEQQRHLLDFWGAYIGDALGLLYVANEQCVREAYESVPSRSDE